MRIQLGDRTKDLVTGFVGICTARTEYVSGCSRVTLQPEVGIDGKIPEPGHFDEPMCLVIEAGVVTSLPSDRGGPRPAPVQHAATPR